MAMWYKSHLCLQLKKLEQKIHASQSTNTSAKHLPRIRPGIESWLRGDTVHSDVRPCTQIVWFPNQGSYYWVTLFSLSTHPIMKLDWERMTRLVHAGARVAQKVETREQEQVDSNNGTESPGLIGSSKW